MADSTHKSILDAVQIGVQALDLTGIVDAAVHVGWGILENPKNFPAVFICAAGTESVVGGTNGSDDIAYPVALYFAARHPLEKLDYIDTALYARQRIRKKFISQRLLTVVPTATGVSTVHSCRLEGSPILEPNILRLFQMLVTPLAFQFISRETRG